jgi:hypothetical protein
MTVERFQALGRDGIPEIHLRPDGEEGFPLDAGASLLFMDETRFMWFLLHMKNSYIAINR